MNPQGAELVGVKVASVAALTFAIFKLFGVVLDLSGITGFILSVGMAVDANILISPQEATNEVGSPHVFTITTNAFPAGTTPTFNSITPALTAPAGFVLGMSLGSPEEAARFAAEQRLHARILRHAKVVALAFEAIALRSIVDEDVDRPAPQDRHCIRAGEALLNPTGESCGPRRESLEAVGSTAREIPVENQDRAPRLAGLRHAPAATDLPVPHPGIDQGHYWRLSALVQPWLLGTERWIVLADRGASSVCRCCVRAEARTARSEHTDVLVRVPPGAGLGRRPTRRASADHPLALASGAREPAVGLSPLTVDGDGECAADLGHSLAAEPTEPLDEDGQRHALDRIEVDG